MLVTEIVPGLVRSKFFGSGLREVSTFGLNNNPMINMFIETDIKNVGT